MATFLSTIKFTDQGLNKIQDTCQRAEDFKNRARQMGAAVQDVFWTLGSYDGLIVLDAPDEETATAAMLALSSEGNVQTQTARAYRAEEMKEILAKVS